ncbi:hypothetical protein R6258_12210 [Halomonas sp. HP20-15]|uniref:hypothetical protein n=1 Tax=Halomonas sp. HP20-15 TaxID=3085901 RepID=UPI002981367C|nr:hypothetical protein [Halomonas sp. HP20-15]MDW5377686.1 hypothetical protein [Halomonas sp. HP20-15]
MFAADAQYVDKGKSRLIDCNYRSIMTWNMESVMRKELIFGIALALGSTGAFAASFESQDANGDGKLSKDEFYSSVSDIGTYSDWDLNDDGLIDDNEFGKLNNDWTYGEWDANGDNYVDSGEFYDGIFTNFDADENGNWDDGEWDDAGNAGLFDI